MSSFFFNAIIMNEKYLRLLPMPPRSAGECYPYEPPYNLPPTYKEGAQKVILIRDLIHYDDRPSWKAGTKGVIIPIQRIDLAELFENIQMYYEHFSEWKKYGGYYPCRLDQTYDFFPFYSDKNGKIRPSKYHTHISFADFQYI